MKRRGEAWRMIFLFVVAISCRQISSHLISTPFRLQKNVLQCGCSKKLYALSPDPNLPRNQTPITIDLTGFFNFNTDTSSGCTMKRGNSAMSTSHLIPAALIALDEINNSTDLLQGYHLKLDVRDSRCDVTHAISELTNSIADRLKGIQPPNSPYNLGIIGPGCEAVTKAVAGVLYRSLRLPIISYGNPPIEGNREEKSILFHTSRSVLLSMKSAIGLLRYFNWTNNIAFISEDSDLFGSIVEGVFKTDVNDNIILIDSNGAIPVQEFSIVNSRNEAGLRTMAQFITSVQQKSIRVIVALLLQNSAAQLICMARSGALPGDGFVYIFVGDFFENWWKTETDYCTITDLDVQSSLFVTREVINPIDSTILMSGHTVQDFKLNYFQRLKDWCNPETYVADLSAGSVYDGVWAFALAMNDSADLINSMTARGLHYDSEILDNIVASLDSINFSGVSGQLHFVNSKRIGVDTIQQIQNGARVVVAQFGEELIVSKEHYFLWNGTNNATPSDQVLAIQESVDLYWLVIVLVFTLAGVVFNIFILTFNWYYGKHKILLASSQKLNYILIAGVFFGYFTVVIFTILQSPYGLVMSDNMFKALCLIQIWMLPLSFTFTYGIMFARAWRIYKIFNDPWGSSRPYTDFHLLLMVIVAAAIDLAILIPWTAIDPYRKFVMFEEVNYESYSQREYPSCSSNNVIIWLAIVAVYKIVFIMVGIVVISLVRQGVIRRKIFDDSRSLATAVYITSVAFVVGLPVSILFLLAGKQWLSYIASALWVNISSSGTLICIFLPKFYKIRIRMDSGNLY